MVESLDGNHTQIAKCSNKTDPRYHTIVGVLQQFIRRDILDDNETRTQQPVLASGIELDGGALPGQLEVQRSS